jgi:hypothetical protein
MNLTVNQIKALTKLYPQITRIVDSVATDANGNEVAYDLSAVTTQAQKDACSMQAKQLLAKTDWAVLPDVGLANQDAFVFYRLNLRNLVRNPVTDPVFESEPTPIWS